MASNPCSRSTSNVTKVLVESRQGSNLLYLPLDKIMQGVRNTPANMPEATPAGSTGTAAPSQFPQRLLYHARDPNPARANVSPDGRSV